MCTITNVYKNGVLNAAEVRSGNRGLLDYYYCTFGVEADVITV